MPFLRRTGSTLLGAIVLALAACGEENTCPRCDTVVVAAISEPASILPPLVDQSVGRDIGDQLYERLAVLEPGGAPIDTTAYRPALAAAWVRVDSLTWRFRLRSNARWQDGRPVTAEDVRFSFDAYSDSTLGSLSWPYLAGKVEVAPQDSTTFLVRFARPSPEQLYDATYHVRIIPKHVWQAVPRSAWAADTATARLVGSGPFRLERWERGQFLILTADSSSSDRPKVRRAIWRFTTDPDAALNLVLSHEADLLETAGSPERTRRAAADSTLRLLPYPSAAYGFLGFNLFDQRRRGPHPLLDRATRRGLALGVDRAVLARSVFGDEAKAPPGPMSRLLWIWSDTIRTLPYDTAAAARTLDAAGWKLAPGEGVRRRGERRLAFDILVPSTSAARRQLAVQLQEAWRRLGAVVTVTAVDFALFQERLGQGRFDSYIGAWLDEPTPRGLGDQWGRSGWRAINYGRYANPAFDSLLAAAGRESSIEKASALYRQAMETLNADAPAIFLYAPANTAVASRRMINVEIDPYSWASGLRGWEASAP